MRVGPLLPSLLVALVLPSFAAAQTTSQLWGSLNLEHVANDHVTYGVDLEPKVLVSAPPGKPSWASLEVTPTVEFPLRNWVDAVGEVDFLYKSQTGDVKTFGLTPRGGALFHVTSRELPELVTRERKPRHRIVIRDLMRVEWTNSFVNNGSPDDSTVRFRNRLELQAPLNRMRVSDDGAYYVTADAEWFVPLGDPADRYANQQRVRVGLGYRRSYAWQFEALYIWNRSREMPQEAFHTTDNIVSVNVARRF